jgi:hypothetical protein
LQGVCESVHRPDKLWRLNGDVDVHLVTPFYEIFFLSVLL